MNIPPNLPPSTMGAISPSPLPTELTEHHSPDLIVIDQNQADPESVDQTFSDPMSIDQTNDDPIVLLVAKDDKGTRTFRVSLSRLNIIPGLYGQLSGGVNFENKAIELKYSPEMINLLLLFCLNYNKDDPTSWDNLEDLFVDETFSFDELYKFYDLANYYAAPLVVEWIKKLIQSKQFFNAIDQDVLKTLWDSIKENGSNELKENQIPDPYYQFILEFLLGQRLHASEFEDVEHLLDWYVRNIGLDYLRSLFNQKNEKGEFLFHLESESLYPLIYYLMNPKEKKEGEISARLEIAFSLLDRFSDLSKDFNKTITAPPPAQPPNLLERYEQVRQKLAGVISPPEIENLVNNHLARMDRLNQNASAPYDHSKDLHGNFIHNRRIVSPSCLQSSRSSPTSSLFLPFFLSLCAIAKNIERKEEFSQLIDRFISQAILPDSNIPIIIRSNSMAFSNSIAVKRFLSLTFDRLTNKALTIEILEFLKIGVDTLLKLESLEMGPIREYFNEIALSFLIKNPHMKFQIGMIEILVMFKHYLLEKDFPEEEVELLFEGFSEIPLSEEKEEELGVFHQMLLHFAEKYPNDRVHFLSVVAFHYENCRLYSKNNLMNEIEEKYFDLNNHFIIKKLFSKIREKEEAQVSVNKIKRILALLEKRNRAKAKIACDDLLFYNKLALESMVKAILEHEKLGYERAFSFAKVLDSPIKCKALEQIFAFLIEKEEFKVVFKFLKEWEKKQMQLREFMPALASTIAIVYLNRKETSRAIDIFKKYILKYLYKKNFSEKTIELLEGFIKTKDEAVIKQIFELDIIINKNAFLEKRIEHYEELLKNKDEATIKEDLVSLFNLPRKKVEHAFFLRKCLPVIYAAKISLADWQGIDRLMTTSGCFSNNLVTLAKSAVLLKKLDLVRPEMVDKFKEQYLSHLEEFHNQLSQYAMDFNKFCLMIATYCISIEDLATVEKFLKEITLKNYLDADAGSSSSGFSDWDYRILKNDFLILKNNISRRGDQGIDFDSFRDYYLNANNPIDMGRKLGDAEDQELLFALLEKCDKERVTALIIAGYLESLSSKSLLACFKFISQSPVGYEDSILICVDPYNKQKEETRSKCLKLISNEGENRGKFYSKTSPKKSPKSTKGNEKVGTTTKRQKRKRIESTKDKEKVALQLIKRVKKEEEKRVKKEEEKEKEKD